MQCQSGSWSFPFQGPVQNFMEDNQRFKNNKIKIPSFYITNSMITVYYFTYIIWLRMKNQHRWELSKKKDSWWFFQQFFIFLVSFLGMLPHKTERGKAALRRLKTYEGCPPPYNKRRRLVVPGAMRILCLKPGRKVILKFFMFSYLFLIHDVIKGNLRLKQLCWNFY